MSRLLTLMPGLLCCALLSAVALLAGEQLLMGAVMLAMLLGLILSSVRAPSPRLESGIQFAETTLLSLAIVLMGFSLDLSILVDLGLSGLMLLVISVLCVVAVVFALVLLRPEHRTLNLLLGMGTLVCGTAAIAAAARPLSASRETVCLSIAVVNLLGLAAMLLLPLVGHSLTTLSDIQLGMLIGNSLPAVGQVAAAGSTLGEPAAQTALLMKMARILMLLPLLLILTLSVRSSRAAGKGQGAIGPGAMPLFLPGFVLAALLANLLPIPEVVMSALDTSGEVLLIMAMAAIGLRLSLPQLLREGRPALLVASLLMLSLIMVSVAGLILIVSQFTV